jgi:hypothetical protein
MVIKCVPGKAELPLTVLTFSPAVDENLANDFLFMSVFGSCLVTSMKFLAYVNDFQWLLRHVQ